MKKFLRKIVNGKDLSNLEMTEIMQSIMNGSADKVTISGFLTAMAMKGETTEELLAALDVMRKFSCQVDASGYLIDTCGTGGDGLDTFNVSTAASIVAASAGVKVAKHGNRAASSQCGSADLMEALGYPLNHFQEVAEKSIENNGFSFLFAPNYHSSMKAVAPIRKTLGFRSLFNKLGPLANPCKLSGQLIGVYDEALMPLYGQMMKELGYKSGLVVHGANGMDEISISGDTKVLELKDGKLKQTCIHPEDFNISLQSIDAIKGGSPSFNVEILKSVFKREKSAYRDAVLINAGAAIMVGQKATSIAEGIEIARHVIDIGRSHQYLEMVLSTIKEASC